jgi:uncharacterized membrane protein
MEPQFNVVFTGELQPGTDRDTFIHAFSQRFKSDEAKAAEVHDAGKAITMKTSVSLAVAEDFKKALETLGMTIRLDPVAATAAETPPAATTPQAPAETPSPEDANPYQAPSAKLEESPEFGEMTGPVSVPIGNGINWISNGYSNHFKGNAGAWIGAVLVLMVISMIPFINLITQLLMPVFVGGLMLGARAQDEGESFRFDSLFQGFKQNTGQLILLSVLFIVAIFVMMFVFAGVMGGSMALMGGMSTNGSTPPDPLAMMLPVLVMLLFFVPLMMAYWFAPALIAINNLSALSAMKLSFFGCLKNILPFLVYGIVLMVLMVVAMLPLLLGLLIMMPVMYASMYTAYRDIYYPEA